MPFTIPEIFGILLTCALVAFAYLSSSIEDRKHNAGFVALTGIALTMLLSMRFDLLPTIEDDLQLNSLANISPEANQLFQTLSQAPTGRIHPLMKNILTVRFDSLVEYFDEESQGRFIVEEAELPNVLMKMIIRANRKILATSYAQPASWWDKPWGKTYEAENEKAVSRGVTVIRTFLFANAEELNSIRNLLAKEAAAGIIVKYAFVANLHKELVNGLVVIDDNLAGKLHLTPQKGVKEAEFYTWPNDIANIQRTIEEIQSEAQDLSSTGQ